MNETCPQCGRASARSLRPLLRRALATSAFVGTLLVAINQGDALLAGHLGASLWWRLPLTYVVPFSVSLHAGFLAARR
ncbi:MAG: nitrate/nitrite transporter NrtS [Deltaproteobacteria bacterium]|nr:nitrate/nitrite transporter NrtS [Deltaproteobacteria bacterium]